MGREKCFLKGAGPVEICVTPYKAKGAVQGFSAQGFVDGQAVSSVKVFCRPVSYFGGWLQAMAVADLKTAATLFSVCVRLAAVERLLGLN